MKTLPLLFILLLPASNLLAQSCMVTVDSLKGSYKGDCKKGRADGMGTATGIDTYTGKFKNGHPDGEGKYTWKNGSTYNGFWKNGLFDGTGTLSKIDESKADSMIIISGFWKKGEYIGKYEKPYVVTPITNNISDINIRRLNTKRAEITLNVKSVTSGGSSLSNPIIPKPQLTDIQYIEGRFDQQANDETSSPVTNKYTLRGVKFPFHAILSFETTGTNAKLHVERIEVEILESNSWFMQVSIDN